MINFDAVDFSERRSEEVMFLLTLRVYVMDMLLLPYLDRLKQSCEISPVAPEP